MMNRCGVAFQTKKKIRRMRQNEEFRLKFGKKLNPSLKYVLILAPHTKGSNTCPYCYWKVKHWGGLASHIWWSLACQAKHNNDNPQLPGTSHDPALTPNCHDTPPGHHNTPLGHHNTPPGTGQHDPDGSDWD